MKRKRRKVNHAAQFEEKMLRFGAILKSSDEAAQYIDDQKVLMEERRLEVEKEIQDADRAERRAEMEAERRKKSLERTGRERIEIERMKMMMGMMKNMTKWFRICHRTTFCLLHCSVRFISTIKRLIFMVNVLIKRRKAAVKLKRYLVFTKVTDNIIGLVGTRSNRGSPVVE